MGQVAPLAAAAVLAGVAAGVGLDVGSAVWLVALAAGWLGAAVAFRRARPRLLAGTLALGCAGAGGALGHRDADLALRPSVLQLTQPGVPGGCDPCPDGPVLVEGLLRSDAERTEFGAAFTLDLTRIRIGSRDLPTSGGVRLSVSGDLAARARDEWRAGRSLRAMATLRRPQAYRNFGMADQEARTALNGIRLFGSVKSATLVEVAGRGAFWREAGAEARARVRRSVEAAIGPANREAAAIVVAVLIGDRAGLSPDVEARLQRAGTFHVIAISGGNIAILVGVMLWLLRRAGLPPRSQAALALAGLGAYAVIVSAGSSVARATLAASIYLVARTLDHRGAATAIVAVTAGALLLARPLFVLDAGFWLTFIASMAILAYAETIAAALARLCRLDPTQPATASRAPLALLAATIAAEGSLAPISAFAFSQVTAAGLVLNFAAVPLMTVVQLAGLATVAGAAVHPALATPGAWVAALAARGITGSAHAVDFAPWTAPHVPPPPLWLTAFGVALWWGIWQPRPRRLRQCAAVLWMCVMAAIVGGWPRTTPDPGAWLPRRVSPCAVPAWRGGSGGAARRLRVSFLDVGQGSSALVELPDGAAILVDAGGWVASRFDIGQRVVSPALWAFGLRHLSAVVLTHGDIDHIGGAAAVIADFRPHEVWEGVPVPSNPLLRDLKQQATALRARWTHVTRGSVQRSSGVELRVWRPPVPDWERPRVRNDDSIVIELRLGDVSFVLPGDISSDVERTIAADFSPASIRVLAAAHHGSRLSTSDLFLDALRPSVAVISVGRDNRHGHPSLDVLARLAQRGVDVYRTDRDGAVSVATDGRRVQLTTCAGRERTIR